jgi:hypothetical protein
MRPASILGRIDSNLATIDSQSMSPTSMLPRKKARFCRAMPTLMQRASILMTSSVRSMQGTSIVSRFHSPSMQPALILGGVDSILATFDSRSMSAPSILLRGNARFSRTTPRLMQRASILTRLPHTKRTSNKDALSPLILPYAPLRTCARRRADVRPIAGNIDPMVSVG